MSDTTDEGPLRAEILSLRARLAACEASKDEATHAFAQQAIRASVEHERATKAEADLAVEREVITTMHANLRKAEADLASMTERANLRAVEYNGLVSSLAAARADVERLTREKNEAVRDNRCWMISVQEGRFVPGAGLHAALASAERMREELLNANNHLGAICEFVSRYGQTDVPSTRRGNVDAILNEAISAQAAIGRAIARAALTTPAPPKCAECERLRTGLERIATNGHDEASRNEARAVLDASPATPREGTVERREAALRRGIEFLWAAYRSAAMDRGTLAGVSDEKLREGNDNLWKMLCSENIVGFDPLTTEARAVPARGGR